MSDSAGILREVNAAIERGDPRSATHLLTDDFVLEDVALGRSDGPEAAVGRWSVLTTAFPDLSFQVARELVSGQVVVQEQVLEGHHRGPFLDVPPTGAAVRFRSAVVAEERGGRLATMRLYRDYSSFVAQFAFLSRAAVIAATLNRTVPIALVVGTAFTMINQLPDVERPVKWVFGCGAWLPPRGGGGRVRGRARSAGAWIEGPPL